MLDSTLEHYLQEDIVVYDLKNDCKQYSPIFHGISDLDLIYARLEADVECKALSPQQYFRLREYLKDHCGTPAEQERSPKPTAKYVGKEQQTFQTIVTIEDQKSRKSHFFTTNNQRHDYIITEWFCRDILSNNIILERSDSAVKLEDLTIGTVMLVKFQVKSHTTIKNVPYTIGNRIKIIKVL